MSEDKAREEMEEKFLIYVNKPRLILSLRSIFKELNTLQDLKWKSLRSSVNEVDDWILCSDTKKIPYIRIAKYLCKKGTPLSLRVEHGDWVLKHN